MKFLLGFVVGIVCGVVATILLLFILGYVANDLKDQGLVLFSEPRDCITKSPLKVFQVLEKDKALVREDHSEENSLREARWYESIEKGENPLEYPRELESLSMLLIASDHQSLYDDMVINIPTNSCARQVGTYKYLTQKDMYRTVPVVRIESI